VRRLFQDLVKDLLSELSLRLKQTVLAVMMIPAEFDAQQLNKAMRVTATEILRSK